MYSSSSSKFRLNYLPHRFCGVNKGSKQHLPLLPSVCLTDAYGAVGPSAL